LTSLTIENYVKTVFGICGGSEQRLASTGELAESLGVSPGSVTSMLKTLQDAGLADYRPYEGVRLTRAGRLLALRVVRRHRLIELFLVKTLKLSWAEVHEEAENMEHAVSDLLIDRIDEFLGFPERDPHGDPIPKADGTIVPLDCQRLSDWKVGGFFRLVRVLDQSPDFLRYLSETGLPLGAIGEVAAHLDPAGIVTVMVAGQATSLAKQAAEKLLVVAYPAEDATL
jgi:DtxR family Mn-dependent transcriptional regulator